MTVEEAAPAASPWRRFSLTLLGTMLPLGLAAAGFIAWMDPYGLRAGPGRPVGPIMDVNQRFLYPQIARGGAYDAAVFGSSTARLLDPRDLDAAFGAHFANLAVNAATPDEQRRLAGLFLARGTTRAVLFGLDATWCAAAPVARTAHPFPEWLYAAGAPWGVLRQVNWQGLTVAGRVALARLGLAGPRVRADGYAVFTPPEGSYDAARAARHIHGGTALDPDAAAPPPSPADPAEAPMPALAWLDALLAATPAPARRIVAFMPVHAGVQGAAGTAQGHREAACKARVAEIGRARDALVVDFRIPSPVTTRDDNYWDALHYRLPIAARIVAGLREAAQTGAEPADGLYRVLARPSAEH